MFIEFSKDRAPRHFRYAVQPQKEIVEPDKSRLGDSTETIARWLQCMFAFSREPQKQESRTDACAACKQPPTLSV